MTRKEVFESFRRTYGTSLALRCFDGIPKGNKFSVQIKNGKKFLTHDKTPIYAILFNRAKLYGASFDTEEELLNKYYQHLTKGIEGVAPLDNMPEYYKIQLSESEAFHKYKYLTIQK